MPHGTYKSLFDKTGEITPLELYGMLGLNTKRAPLTFTLTEINQAYRQRALRLHPDKQNGHDIKIPAALCSELNSDLMRARDHLLAGDKYIQGTGKYPESELSPTGKWLAEWLATKLAAWASWFNDNPDFLGAVVLCLWYAQFTEDERLLMRAEHDLAEQDRMLPQLIMFTFIIIEFCAMADSVDPAPLLDWINLMTPPVQRLPLITKLVAMLNSEDLPTVLAKYTIVLQILPLLMGKKTVASMYEQLAAPSVFLLIGGYISSMLFTTDTLSKMIAVYRDVAYLIMQQNNILDAVKLSSAILVLSLVMLPLNIITSLIDCTNGTRLWWLISRDAWMLPFVEFAKTVWEICEDVGDGDLSLAYLGRLLQATIWLVWELNTIELRFSCQITIGVMDNLMFWLGGQRVLQLQIDGAAAYLGQLTGYLQVATDAPVVTERALTQVQPRHDDMSTSHQAQSFASFLHGVRSPLAQAAAPPRPSCKEFLLSPEDDVWLQEVLAVAAAMQSNVVESNVVHPSDPRSAGLVGLYSRLL